LSKFTSNSDSTIQFYNSILQLNRAIQYNSGTGCLLLALNDHQW